VSTIVWWEMPMPRKRNGRYTNEKVDATDESPAEGFRPALAYECEHVNLRGEKRCLGCGRTKNEVALDGE
jgi:hypothetical protein